MNFDDLSGVRLDRDPDDLLPEGWDDIEDGEIGISGLRLRDLVEGADLNR